MQIVFEKPAESHDPDLYRADGIATGVHGLGKITEKQLDSYHQLGYLLIRDAIPDSMVDSALEELHQMAEQIDPVCSVVNYEGTLRDLMETLVGGPLEKAQPEAIREALVSVDQERRMAAIRKFHGFTRDHKALRDISSYAPLRSTLRTILKAEPRLFQSMALIKPPGGREKPWHQDHAYFDYPLDARICGVWIALQRVDMVNGCMFALEGEHRSGPRVHFKRRDWQICDTDIPGHRQVAFPMEPGDLMIFDAKLPHGTPTNRSNTQRWALQYHFHGAGLEKADQELRLAIFGSEGKGVYC